MAANRPRRKLKPARFQTQPGFLLPYQLQGKGHNNIATMHSHNGGNGSCQKCQKTSLGHPWVDSDRIEIYLFARVHHCHGKSRFSTYQENHSYGTNYTYLSASFCFLAPATGLIASHESSLRHCVYKPNHQSNAKPFQSSLAYSPSRALFPFLSISLSSVRSRFSNITSHHIMGSGDQIANWPASNSCIHEEKSGAQYSIALSAVSRNSRFHSGTLPLCSAP
jgi:hypothetical protein